MGLFDFLFPVEMPLRETPLAYSRHADALASVIAELRRVREEEKARRAAEAEARRAEAARLAEERPERVRDFSIRHKTRILTPEAEVEIRSTLAQAVDFAECLRRFVRERCDGRASVCYKRAGLSRQVYSHLISKPTCGVAKRTVMRLAVGLELSLGEAIPFMASAGFAFSDSIEEDVVFSYCLKNGIYNIIDVSNLLAAMKCEPLDIVR